MSLFFTRLSGLISFFSFVRSSVEAVRNARYFVRAGFLTSTAENLFKTILSMQPQDAVDTTAGALSKEDKVKALIEDLLDKLPEQFNMQELMSKVSIHDDRIYRDC